MKTAGKETRNDGGGQASETKSEKRPYETKKFFLTNTMTGKREEFWPQNPPRVLFYSCGPTVYGPLHIGNARALLFSDLLFRWLKHIGYDVNYVRNYTDVDDKIIARANQEKVDERKIADRYIAVCEQDMASLDLQNPTRIVRVTDSMDDIVKLIGKIIENGHAYVVDGEVLYSIESFKSYGKLSGRNVDELQAGARVEIDRKKRSPLDFALWKPHKLADPSGSQGVEPTGSPRSEPHWPSPWGPGRPGWHIECSAMAGRWLGKTIDIHHGGQDLIFPHHENEIAQSEAATGATFCRHWVHHAFMTMGQEKMSKSLGNIFMIGDFVSRYGAETLKYIYVSHHYRSVVDFSEELILKALDEIERVYLAKRWAEHAARLHGERELTDHPSAQKWKSFRPRTEGGEAKIEECRSKIEEEMFSDLNTPGALGSLFTLIREINRAEAEASGKPGLSAPPNDQRAAVATEFFGLLNEYVSPLLNVFGENADTMLRHLDRVRGEINRARAGDGSEAALTDDEIRKFIEARAAARKDRDFKRADDIRKELDAKGILLVDGPQGTTWKNK